MVLAPRWSHFVAGTLRRSQVSLDVCGSSSDGTISGRGTHRCARNMLSASSTFFPFTAVLTRSAQSRCHTRAGRTEDGRECVESIEDEVGGFAAPRELVELKLAAVEPVCLSDPLHELQKIQDVVSVGEKAPGGVDCRKTGAPPRCA